MIFGSMIGGATSEGGGAVAFPVMTLALNIDSSVARDFSLMCQSCGKLIKLTLVKFSQVKLGLVSFSWTKLRQINYVISRQFDKTVS